MKRSYGVTACLAWIAALVLAPAISAGPVIEDAPQRASDRVQMRASDRAKTRASDRGQIRGDRAELVRDVVQVRRLERLLVRWDDAHRSLDEPAERRIRRQIHAFLMREVADARRQVARDRRELDQSNRDLRRHRNSGRRPLWGDRRNRRDDALDLASSRGRLAREQEILFELRTLQPRIRRDDRDAEARERDLFQEFLVIARRDAAASGRELGEDRRELRDRREEATRRR